MGTEKTPGTLASAMSAMEVVLVLRRGVLFLRRRKSCSPSSAPLTEERMISWIF